MADEFSYAPIVVISGTPRECLPELPQFEVNNDLPHVQSWPASSNVPHSKGALTLQMSHQASSYLTSPVSPTPYPSSPISSTSSALSMSPCGLAAAFGDFTLVDDLRQEKPCLWSLDTDTDVSNGHSSLSSGGSASSEGLNLTIPGASDQITNVYPLSTTSEEDLNDLFNETISVNFEESSNTFDHDSSPSQTDFVSYLSPWHSESSASLFHATHSVVPSVPNALTSADLLPTTSKIHEGTLQRHHQYGISSSSLLSPDGHEDNRQLRRHNRSYSNSFISSNVGGLSSSALLTPDVFLADSNTNQLHRRHSHSAGGQRAPEIQGQLRRAKSRSPYARPRVISPADAYLATSDDNRHRCDTRTAEQSAPPSPLPPSSPHSRNVQQNPEDMFRRYNNAPGRGYPILQRDTIASDAVLQASAKRRKKVASYKCETCGQMLTSRDNLNNHMDAHQGIRRHQCDYCQERFRTRSVLKRHQKSMKCPASRSSSTTDKEPPGC